MNDQTQNETKTAFCKKDFTNEGVVTFTFGNDTVVTLDTNALSDEQKFNLLMHGAMQKIGDSFAGAKGNYTIGVAAAQKVCDQLLNDQWTASRASAGEGAPRIGELVQALANLKKADVNAVAAAVEKATEEQRKAWRKNAAVAAEIARIRSEKAAARAAKATADAGGASLDDIGL